MKTPLLIPKGQKGAALIIGLLLLTVITLLAITGMNSASTELVMAGNEQYRASAFEASEAGIEQALSALQLVPLDGTPRTVGPTLVPGSTTARYATDTRHMGIVTMVDATGVNKFIAHYFEINSVGTSARNAQAVHAQGAYYLSAVPAGAAP